MSPASAKASTIDQLRRQLIQTQVEASSRAVVSTGFASLDALLPDSGLMAGSVIEWISDSVGLRTTSIALKCAAGLLNHPGALAVVDSDASFHPTSMSHLGIPLERLLLVRPDAGRSGGHDSSGRRSPSFGRAESLWALEQLTRCSGVRIVLAWVDRLSSTAQRRLQLAVENSGVTVMLIRPAMAAKQTSWSDLRFQVSAERRSPAGPNEDFAPHFSVRLLRCRNAVQSTGRVMMRVSDETGDVSEISELAGSAQTTSPTR